MFLQFLPVGSHFVVPEAPELGRGTLLKSNDCRCLVQWDRPPEYVHYETASGKSVEFYRTAKPESVTPYMEIRPVR